MEAPYVVGMYLQKSLVIECKPCFAKIWWTIVWTTLDPLAEMEYGEPQQYA